MYLFRTLVRVVLPRSMTRYGHALDFYTLMNMRTQHLTFKVIIRIRFPPGKSLATIFSALFLHKQGHLIRYKKSTIKMYKYAYFTINAILFGIKVVKTISKRNLKRLKIFVGYLVVKSVVTTF